jgi:sarcosine oxidase
MKRCDVAVVGAGVFGSWVALCLREQGLTVTLLDQYGAANSLCSSGAESRIIRMGYGPNELYTRWSADALDVWKRLADETGEKLFYETGVLLIAEKHIEQLIDTVASLDKVGIPFQRLSRSELDRMFPQFDFGAVEQGVFEPNSGALCARRAVKALVGLCVQKGVEYAEEAVTVSLPKKGPLTCVTTAKGERICADTFVFACGSWLPKVFPELLGDRIFVTRQDSFFFSCPSGNKSYCYPNFPVWIEIGVFYGFPDLENMGVKVASDEHGVPFDPDSGSRETTDAALRTTREFIAKRLPGLKESHVVSSNVCQFENTSNGDFIIDRHPASDNVWIVGGGSGHGFKHGPSVGRYVRDLILQGGAIEDRFKLATKEKVKSREIY